MLLRGFSYSRSPEGIDPGPHHELGVEYVIHVYQRRT